nr:MAG TPA: RAG1 Recombination-activating protein 1 zinc-finger domain [Caudoviricetes sp.]
MMALSPFCHHAQNHKEKINKDLKVKLYKIY